MDLPELGPISQYTRIPKILCSSDTGKPFTNCMVCNQYLLNDGTPYVIEKAVKNHKDLKVKEVIFEYAMCLSCSVKMNSSLSEESRQRIDTYFQENTDLAKRRARLLGKKTIRPNDWINRCVIKDTPIRNSGEYQIVAQCDGKHMLFSYMPFALSMEALDEISSLLSAKSLGEIDDFMGKYFTGPPEVSEILKKRFVLV
jgi:hypothetical protein